MHSSPDFSSEVISFTVKGDNKNDSGYLFRTPTEAVALIEANFKFYAVI
ncbi:MAG: hypothetical protein FWD52_08355 [Candidatus Bathyarchaeota archaeon]|nr:hypothetical protein [Candidatus Termiticorpusculum sp.]